MMGILEFRARMRMIYQKFQAFIDPVIKFIAALIVFMIINKFIGYDARFTKFPVVFLLALLSAFTPSAILVLLSMILVCAHVFFVSKVLVIILLVVFIILYCFFLRFAPKYGFALLAVPVLFSVKMPFAVPILLGLISNPVTILPASCGVVVYFLLFIIKEEAVTEIAKSLDDTLLLYTRVIDKLLKNKQMFMTIIVFAVIITVVYIVRRLKIEYAAEIAIGAGSLVCILGFLIVYLKLDISKQIGTMILGTFGSAIIVLVIQFFRRVLDYTAVENVQFEDDDYYYYVKAVPKINVSVPQMNVKHITAKKDTPSEEIEKDLEEELTDEVPGNGNRTLGKTRSKLTAEKQKTNSFEEKKYKNP